MNLAPLPVEKFFGNDGRPLNGGLLFTYVAATTTKIATYTDSTGGTPNTNPIVLNFRGEANIWLDPLLVYKFVLSPPGDTDPPTNPIWTVDNITAAIGITTLTQQFLGQILNPRTPAEIAALVTPTDYSVPSHEKVGVLLPRRYNVLPDGTDSATGLANAFAVAIQLGGGTVQFSAGTFRFNTWPAQPTNTIIQGVGAYQTIFDMRVANGGTNIAVDVRGTGSGGFPSDRKIIGFRDLTFDGLNCGNAVSGLALGWNMRSAPLLRSVRIRRFSDWGVKCLGPLIGQNWNIDFYDVEMDSCGNTASNSGGWFKDPSVDGGTWNFINFYFCFTEACGSASSTAGGMNFQTTTSNRGLNLVSCEWENNRGSLQVFVTNMAALNISNPYIEMPSGAAEAQCGMEFDGCTGFVAGGFLGAADANNKFGLRFKASSRMSARDVHFGTTWNTSSFDVQGSVLENRNCVRSTGQLATVTLDASAEIYGDIRPFWHVTSNANQTGIVDSTFTKVQWQTKNADITSCFDNVSNYRATPRTRGWYGIDVQVRWDTNVTAYDQYLLVIEVNGAIAKEKLLRPGALAALEQQAHFDIELTATSDFIEIFVRHVDTAPANRTLVTGVTVTWFKGELIQVKVA